MLNADAFTALSALVPEKLALVAVWSFFVALLVTVARNADHENFRRCTFWCLFGLVVAQLLGMVDLRVALLDHWRLTVVGAVGYLALGFPWVYLYEWDRFLAEEYARRNDVLAKLPPDRAASHDFNRPIKARSHKAKIIGWIVWWPMMLLYALVIRWFLCAADQIVLAWKQLFERVVHLFQEKSDRQFKRYIQIGEPER